MVVGKVVVVVVVVVVVSSSSNGSRGISMVVVALKYFPDSLSS